ncbi:MAG: hypothetical protein V7K71_32470 [Nostoc sp.]|uniref:hypothetical protein n=1 Tax=Nostoc sp. TaxID=1180 RepID=UPI002FF98F63
MVQIDENCCSCCLRSEVIQAPDILHSCTGSRGYTGKTRTSLRDAARSLLPRRGTTWFDSGSIERSRDAH